MRKADVGIQGKRSGQHSCDADAEKGLAEQLRRCPVGILRQGFYPRNKFPARSQQEIAKDEALEVGAFRSGQVGIAGTDYHPPAAGEALHRAFEVLLGNYAAAASIPEKAFGLFLDAARAQFFYDGNKRTGQLIMSGVLMTNGFAPLTIFADAQLEYHRLMLNFYASGDKTDMFTFLAGQYARIAEKFVRE